MNFPLSTAFIEVPEEEDKKKDHEKILEEIIDENFPKMGKEIITQVQETQRVPNRRYSIWIGGTGQNVYVILRFVFTCRVKKYTEYLKK